MELRWTLCGQVPVGRRGWGAGGFARPELKRHQEKERAITGWYLRDDTVSFQVLKYRK